MFKKILLFLIWFNYCCGQVPNTDLWLFPIKKEKEKYLIEKGENITNRDGYDNQPSFSEDNKRIYYVSIRQDKQADMYVYEISGKKNTQLTKTVESEYSPVFINSDKSINSVVVEKDSTQRIWLYDEKTGAQKKILFDEDSVGYYNFLNADTVLYYKLTKPHSLRAHCISSGKDVLISDNPIRGFKTINRHEFIFGRKDSAKVIFYVYNTLLQKAKLYCEYNSLNEDILWHPLWGLLKSEQTAILRFDEKQNKWLTLFDFSVYKISKITRFDFDLKNKRIVVVNNL
jgi:hypothetical protein